MPVTFFLLIFSASAGYAENPRLVLTSYILEPLGNRQGTGQLDKFVTEMFRRAGLDVSIKWYEGQRSIELLRHRKVDGHIGRIRQVADEIPTTAVIEAPVYRSNYVIVALRPDIRVENWEGIKQYRSVYPLGWRVFEKNKIITASARPVQHLLEMSEMLLKGEADLMIFEWGHVPFLFEAHNHREFYAVSPVLESQDVFVLLDDKWADYRGALAKISRSMLKAGEMAEYCPICAQSLTLQ